MSQKRDIRKARISGIHPVYILSFLTFLFLFSLFFFFTPLTTAVSSNFPEAVETIEIPYMGNINNSYAVEVSDAIEILRHIVGLTELRGDFLQRADVNFDGHVTITDAILVLRHIVGITERFPASDPAFVSTENALIYLINKTTAENIKITADIELEKELQISRNISLIASPSPDNREVIMISGNNLTILGEVTSFTVSNFHLSGSITFNTSEEQVAFNMEGDCLIPRAVINRDALVKGGDSIISAFHPKDYKIEWLDNRKPFKLESEAIRLTVLKQPPAIRRDGSGKVGEIEIAAEDIYLNTTTAGLAEIGKILVTAQLSSGDFTHDSIVTKEMGADGKVIFSEGDLVIKGNKSTAGLTIKFSIDELGSTTTNPFHILMASDIHTGSTTLMRISAEEVEAGYSNIEIELVIVDSSGTPMEGSYYVEIFASSDDYWLSEPYKFNEKGETHLIVNQTLAGQYSNITVSVDGFVVGTFDVQINPAPPVSVEFTEKEYMGVFNVQPGETRDIGVTVTDEYGNPVGEVNVEALLYLYSNKEEIPFDSGSASLKTDERGEALFNDLTVNEYGIYDIVFSFETARREATGFFIVWPADTLVYWSGYPDSIDGIRLYGSERDTYFVFVKNEDGTEHLVEDYKYEAFYCDTNEMVPYEILQLTRTGETAPGIYYGGFQYIADVEEPVEIRMNVYYRDTLIKEDIPLIISPR